MYYCGPIADVIRVADGAHVCDVVGPWGEVGKLNGGGSCDVTGVGVVRRETGDFAVLVFPFMAVSGTGPAQCGTSLFNVGDVDVSGGITGRDGRGEVYRFRPIAEVVRVADGAHAGIVAGHGGEVCELNRGSSCRVIGDNVRGEIGGCAVLVFPFAVAVSAPTQYGGSRVDIGGAEVGGVRTRCYGSEAYRFAPIAVVYRAADGAHTEIVGGSGREIVKRLNRVVSRYAFGHDD